MSDAIKIDTRLLEYMDSFGIPREESEAVLRGVPQGHLEMALKNIPNIPQSERVDLEHAKSYGIDALFYVIVTHDVSSGNIIQRLLYAQQFKEGRIRKPTNDAFDSP